MNGQIVAEKRGGQHRVLTADPLGSAIDVRDSSGSQLASYNYWPYGSIRTSTGSITNPWRFCGTWGYYFDGASYYVRARTYRPELTRWLTVDPLWPTEDSYAYVSAEPGMIVDPFGKQGVIGPRPKPGAISAPNFDHCGVAFVDVAVMRACDELACCYNYPPCRNALLKCYTEAGLPRALDCMLRKCNGKDFFSLSCNNDNVACSCYGRCGQVPASIIGSFGGCSILLCPDNIAKPGCGGGDYTWSFMHELSHCCGATDENDQADDLGNCISEAVRIHRCRP